MSEPGAVSSRTEEVLPTVGNGSLPGAEGVVSAAQQHNAAESKKARSFFIENTNLLCVEIRIAQMDRKIHIVSCSGKIT